MLQSLDMLTHMLNFELSKSPVLGSTTKIGASASDELLSRNLRP